jgi:Na+-transporting NADH:ubiquinone oxidoreductase subunit NqrF
LLINILFFTAAAVQTADSPPPAACNNMMCGPAMMSATLSKEALIESLFRARHCIKTTTWQGAL